MLQSWSRRNIWPLKKTLSTSAVEAKLKKKLCVSLWNEKKKTRVQEEIALVQLKKSRRVEIARPPPLPSTDPTWPPWRWDTRRGGSSGWAPRPRGGCSTGWATPGSGRPPPRGWRRRWRRPARGRRSTGRGLAGIASVGALDMWVTGYKWFTWSTCGSPTNTTSVRLLVGCPNARAGVKIAKKKTITLRATYSLLITTSGIALSCTNIGRVWAIKLVEPVLAVRHLYVSLTTTFKAHETLAKVWLMSPSGNPYVYHGRGNSLSDPLSRRVEPWLLVMMRMKTKLRAQ